MNQTYDAIVVGGGIVGASAAYHLAKQGANTLLIDRNDAGRATNAGAGILAPETNRRDPDVWVNFAIESVSYYQPLIAALAELDAGETSYAQCGMLIVAATEDEVDAFEAAQRHILARQAARGAPSTDDLHPISPGEARERFPKLGNVLGAIYNGNAARVDGRLMAQALRTGAEKLGVQILHSSVERLSMQGNQVSGVVTAEGEIAADQVIIAGGAWSPHFGDQLDIRIPVEPQKGQIAHLRVPGEPTGTWPIVGAFGDHYIVPWDDQRIAVGATRETGSGYDTVTSVAGIREVLTEAMRVAPGLASASLIEVRVGLRPLPPDGLPVMGSVPGMDGIHLVTGHGPTGLQLGPYSGKIVAEMALGNAPQTDISPFSVARFPVTVTESDKVVACPKSLFKRGTFFPVLNHRCEFLPERFWNFHGCRLSILRCFMRQPCPRNCCRNLWMPATPLQRGSDQGNIIFLGTVAESCPHAPDKRGYNCGQSSAPLQSVLWQANPAPME